MTTTSDIDRLTDRTPRADCGGSIPIFAAARPDALRAAPTITSRRCSALRQPHHQMLCVTLGEQGAMALDADGIHVAPAFQVEAVDTTGAGDVFRAGFIYALLRGWSTDDILRFANAAAAVSCTRLGALGGIPSSRRSRGAAASGKVRRLKCVWRAGPRCMVVAFGRLRLAVIVLLAAALLRAPCRPSAPDVSMSPQPAEAVADVTARCDQCAWETAGARRSCCASRSTAATSSICRCRGRAAPTYRVMLGAVTARHARRPRRDRCASSPRAALRDRGRRRRIHRGRADRREARRVSRRCRWRRSSTRGPTPSAASTTCRCSCGTRSSRRQRAPATATRSSSRTKTAARRPIG